MAKNRTFKGALQGYIFYDRLQNNPEGSFLHKLYEHAAEDLDDAENIFDDRAEPSRYSSMLRQHAAAERARELKFLQDSFGLNISASQLDTIAMNRELVHMFNDAMNLSILWKQTAQRISALGDYIKANPNNEWAGSKGIEARNLIEERFLYQVDQYYKNNAIPFIDRCFTILLQQDKFAEASIAKDVDTITQMLNSEISKQWPRFVDEMLVWAFNNIGSQYKKESTGNTAKWQEIADAIKHNQALMDQFTSRYRTILMTQYTEAHKKMSEAVAQNLIAATKDGKVRGNKNAQQGIYSKQVRSAAHKIKPLIKTSRKRASQRGQLAEIFGVSVVKSLAEGGQKDIKIKTNVTGGVSTVFDIDTVEVFYKGDIEMPSLREVLLQQMPGKEAGTVKIGSKGDAATAITEYERVATSLDPTASMVYESIKNYDMGFYFQQHGGFSGTSMSYSSAADVLSNILKKDKDSVKLYLVKLMNTMKGAMYGEMDKTHQIELMTEAMANNVASFLFDDMYAEVQGKSTGANKIHLFRLSDIVVPLSVFLEGMAGAFANWASDPQQAMRWFKIGYKNASEIKYDNDNYGGLAEAEHAWGLQRKEAWRNFEITTTFFGDFITEVKKYL